MRSAKAIDLIVGEFFQASKKHGRFNSAHEGYAVILEELDELWDEVKKREPDNDRLVQEATQVAAMAMRFLVDITVGWPEVEDDLDVDT